MKAESLKPLTGEIMEIDNGLGRSQERIRQASKDFRMAAIVEHISLADGEPVDYEFIGGLLDDVERQYGMFPIEVVEAYGICMQRYNYAQMELLDA